MSDSSVPNRWMQLRQPAGFTPEDFDCFSAHAEAFASYARAWLQNWRRAPGRSEHPNIEYFFFPTEISEDGRVVSLPLGGSSTLSTRAALENGSSYMLWQFLPARCMEGLEEALTETLDSATGPQTNWRLPNQSIGFVNANPELRKRYAL
jgi:hypothetical protein